MTPRLVLLTGPAAGEVAKALRPEDCERCDVSMEPCSLCPVRLDFEVRDYWEAIVLIVQDPPVKPHCKTPKDWAIVVGIAQQDVRSVGTESRIRSVTGGEAWLVGLVLPETAWYSTIAFQGGEKEAKSLPEFAHHIRENGAIARKEKGLPARLAILAPEPPPLLVERVRAWGGEVWECGISAAPATAGKCLVTFGTKCFYADTWPEVVRAALGEVAP